MHAGIKFAVALASLLGATSVSAQSMVIDLSSDDVIVGNVFSDVDTFEFTIEIDAELTVGAFDNPPISGVEYRVNGVLAEGTPSGFPAFDLVRSITGDEFYAQGSSLQFVIADSAVLDDGVQIGELVGAEMALRFDAREIDTGRFHPPVLTLGTNGTGRLLNSNNVPTLDPRQDVEPGSEYINNLMFDAGNTTIITGTGAGAGAGASASGGGGSGSVNLWALVVMVLSGGVRRIGARRGVARGVKP